MSSSLVLRLPFRLPVDLLDDLDTNVLVVERDLCERLCQLVRPKLLVNLDRISRGTEVTLKRLPSQFFLQPHLALP